MSVLGRFFSLYIGGSTVLLMFGRENAEVFIRVEGVVWFSLQAPASQREGAATGVCSFGRCSGWQCGWSDEAG